MGWVSPRSPDALFKQQGSTLSGAECSFYCLNEPPRVHKQLAQSPSALFIGNRQPVKAGWGCIFIAVGCVSFHGGRKQIADAKPRIGDWGGLEGQTRQKGPLIRDKTSPNLGLEFRSIRKPRHGLLWA